MAEPTQLQPVQAPHVEGNARCCRVPGCTADLAKEAEYSRKHRVCKVHRDASEVMLPEGLHKWCQGCTAYRVTELFRKKTGRCDNCLKKLAKSHKRIRADTETEDSDSDSDSARKARRPTKQAKPGRKGNTRTAAKQQKASTERKARKAGGTSTSPPSSPMSTHTELYTTEPHLPQLHHYGTSGPSSSVGLTPLHIPHGLPPSHIPHDITPSHIPHGNSLGNTYPRAQTQLSAQMALISVPSQVPLASGSGCHWHGAAVPTPVGGPATEPFPDFDSVLSLNEGMYDLSQCVDCLPALPSGLDSDAIISDGAFMWPEQIPMFDTGLLTMDHDQLLEAELQRLLDGI